MRYKGRKPDLSERLGDVIIENLSFDRILSFVISIAIILAVIHYIVIPLSHGIGKDLGDTGNQTGAVQQQLAAD